ncbi:TetR family transcriptional regulator [Mesorhizobium sp. L-8-10]|uniref:TetR/AcrR family transcriptional regulator n=1 Tax=unclassified Mesorhizobium TaxID=325217 RepID=UPI001925B3B5|nr:MULTISPECIES: TetR/AcrR family transcriptional regulator [unclassified Mesorhizobium]BCH25656.1 TetR family transcriptional regulator [Mesorhizobium sp. L-8-3]BCH33651.1 TetR family transcriptional regulator [Mesorhizobium sp. L-8-10]
MNEQPPGRAGPSRRYERSLPSNDPDRTRADILKAAEAEFARHGFGGAKLDSIAAKTKRSKRMIYYYFSSKAKLYLAVLENGYRRMRTAELAINLDEDDPRQSLKNLVEFSFDFHFAHPTYVKLLMTENLNDARFLATSSVVQELHQPIIARIERLLRRGYEKENFRRTISPVEVHMTISALSFFNVSNRATFTAAFNVDMQSPAFRRARKQEILLTILGRLDADMTGFGSEYTR